MTSTLHQRIATARSVLFVPGHRPDRFDKATASGTDAIVLDLEDAVAPADKDDARQWVQHWLDRGNTAAVRINGNDTEWHDEDVRTVAGRAAAIMVPKAESRDELDRIAQHAERAALIPLIETALGVTNAVEVCRGAAVVRAAFGSIDLAAQLGVDPESHDALRHARCAVVLASAAAGRAAPLDGVTTAIRDPEVLHADIAHAKSLGFSGKLCIHPGQLDAVNHEFLPSDDDISWASAVLAAASDTAVTVHDGRMIDRPVLLRAQTILARAAG